MPLVSLTRAILRSAEFGFLGVIVRTLRQTPRFCGAPGMFSWRCRILFQFLRMAGAFTFVIFGRRPLRTSWLIVGTADADSFLWSALTVSGSTDPSSGPSGPTTVVSGCSSRAGPGDLSGPVA